MSVDIKVPTVGESISSGILGSWKKTPGQYVKEGEPLFEIETDKVTSEVFAPTSGTLEQLVSEGAEVAIGQVVARIDDTAPAPASSAPAPAQKAAPAPAASEVTSSPQTEALPPSPAVRKLIEEKKLDPATLVGSGKGGRLLKEDVIKAANPSSHAKSLPPSERTTRKKLSPLRAKIAQRLVSAQHEAAMLTTFNEVDMTNVMQIRQRFQDRFMETHGVKLGFMSFFVKATVHALRSVPALNARLEGNEIVQNHFYDLGIAISTPKGLMVPVLRDADHLSLAGIETAIANYSKKARDGKISLDDLDGGVFTITNGGVFGSLLSTPILNPPQSGILGMHTIQDRPVAINGRVEIRPMMYLALTYDHRIVDGKEAVTSLVRIKEYIEQPGVAGLDL
ncbi:MAG: 2-oxoglutarate dehydrogenase complex dihydrolipoyllysine-residue succinyltransferase [Candidatus Methylacidiphilales bacterium]